MAKVYQFLIILTGISILLGLFGMHTFGGIILTALGFDSNVIDSSSSSSNPLSGLEKGQLWSLTVGGIFALAAVATLVTGLITRTSADSAIRATLCGFLATFVSDFLAIVSEFKASVTGVELSWLYGLVILIYVPLIAGYIISLVSFWGGQDV